MINNCPQITKNCNLANRPDREAGFSSTRTMVSYPAYAKALAGAVVMLFA